MPCRATVRKMNALHIPYEKIDVTKDPEAMAKVKGMGFLESPVVLVEGLTGGSQPDALAWSGYRPDDINELAARLAPDDVA